MTPGIRPRPRDHELAGYPLNYSNRVVFDEDAMAVGVALYAAAAEQLDREMPGG